MKIAEDDAVEFGAFDCGTESCGFGHPGKQPVKSISAVADSTFHHVAGVRRANGDLDIYVDGELENSITGQPSTDTDSSARLGIGGVNGQQFFDGLIDEVDVYNRALTAAEIRDIVAAGSAGKCRSANVASWTLACFDSVMLRYQGGGGGDRGSPMEGGPYASPTLWFYSGPAPQQDWTLSARDAFAPLVEGTVMGTAIPFTFNSPFGFHAAILAQVEMHCNPGTDTGELPCENWVGTGFANFSNVATISSIRVFNSAGDPVTNFHITAQSGTNYAPGTP